MTDTNPSSRGGRTTAARYGSDHMREIGRRGGLKHSPEHMRTIAHRGGAAYREQMTDEDFRDQDAERRRRND